MRTTVIILAAIIIIAGAGYFIYRISGAGAPSQAQVAAQQQAQEQAVAQQAQNAPQPILATVVSIKGNTFTVQAQGTTTTQDIIVTPSTGIFDSGKPISWQALKAGELVAVVMYPPSIGAGNVAQTITAVSGQ